MIIITTHNGGQKYLCFVGVKGSWFALVQVCWTKVPMLRGSERFVVYISTSSVDKSTYVTRE